MSLSKIEETINVLRDNASCNNQCLIASGGLKHTGLVNQVHLGKMVPMNGTYLPRNKTMYEELYHIKYRSEVEVDINDSKFEGIVNAIRHFLNIPLKNGTTDKEKWVRITSIKNLGILQYPVIVDQDRVRVKNTGEQISDECKVSMGKYNVMVLSELTDVEDRCQIAFIMHETMEEENKPVQKYMWIQHNIGSMYHDHHAENIFGYSAYSLRNVVLRFYFNTRENRLELDAKHVYGGEDGFVLSEMFVNQLFKVESGNIDTRPNDNMEITSVDYSLYFFQLQYTKSFVCSFYHSRDNKSMVAHVKALQQRNLENNVTQCEHFNDLLRDETAFKAGKKYHWFVRELCQKTSQLHLGNPHSIWAFHVCCIGYTLSKPDSEHHPQLKQLSSRPIHFTSPGMNTSFMDEEFQRLYEEHADRVGYEKTQFKNACENITDYVHGTKNQRDRQWVECRENENDIPFIMECLASMPNHDGRIVEKFVVGNEGLQQKPKFMLYRFRTDFLRNQNIGCLSSNYRKLLANLNKEVFGSHGVRHVTYVYLDNDTGKVMRIDFSPTVKDDHVGALMCTMPKSSKRKVGHIRAVMYGHNAKFEHKKTSAQTLFDINTRSNNRTKIIVNLLQNKEIKPIGRHIGEVNNLQETRFWNFTIGFLHVKYTQETNHMNVESSTESTEYCCYLLLQGHSELRQKRAATRGAKWVIQKEI